MLQAKDSKQKKEINLLSGDVIIEGPVGKDYITSLAIDSNLNNFRNPMRQKEAIMMVADLPEGLVYVAVHDKTIIGYVDFHYPSRYTRWSRHPRLLELGAIEVSRQWQRQGIATFLLKKAFENPIMEEYILIVTEFHQHWDLRGSKQNFWNYRKMLMKLYGSVGFKRKHTNDPEIIEHPANILMARIGRSLNNAYIKAFDELSYQQSLVD